MHDENGNGEFDRNFPDEPLEPYRFGNGATLHFFRPPTFDEAAVGLSNGDNAIRIALTLP